MILVCVPRECNPSGQPDVYTENTVLTLTRVGVSIRQRGIRVYLVEK